MSKERLLSLFILLGCQVETPRAKTPEASPVPSPLAGTEVHAGRAPGKIQPGVSSDCANYSVIAQGPYQYQNNMWASDKAKSPFEQCVLSRQLDGKTQLGWTWAWPGFERLGFGYPEIIFGWKPWSNGSTAASLPVRISDLHSLTVRYAVATERTGQVALRSRCS